MTAPRPAEQRKATSPLPIAMTATFGVNVARSHLFSRGSRDACPRTPYLRLRSCGAERRPLRLPASPRCRAQGPPRCAPPHRPAAWIRFQVGPRARRLPRRAPHLPARRLHRSGDRRRPHHPAPWRHAPVLASLQLAGPVRALSLPVEAGEGAADPMSRLALDQRLRRRLRAFRPSRGKAITMSGTLMNRSSGRTLGSKVIEMNRLNMASTFPAGPMFTMAGRQPLHGDPALHNKESGPSANSDGYPRYRRAQGRAQPLSSAARFPGSSAVGPTPGGGTDFAERMGTGAGRFARDPDETEFPQ
ncbi:hypothetical protein EDC22_102349 [Tepidamorphus gemmatus]|uniref:Uncharacterized protein n=1 Tax=Tepidamorphus gemmatus TaxID=747076 RepID=A0A4R3MJR3_9HYPH|nr:hypothetical protein EDC22_102349 [Tepidamorphus gemmatus]